MLHYNFLFLQIWIRALGEGTDKVWLGSTDFGHRGIWINADGSSYFGNWLPTQPDNKQGNERCMQLGIIDLEYGPKDRPCEEEGAGYICELNIDPDNKCPYGWRREKQSCYTNKDDEQEWSGAVVLCNYHNGAHPTFIDDIYELVSYPFSFQSYTILLNNLQSCLSKFTKVVLNEW